MRGPNRRSSRRSRVACANFPEEGGNSRRAEFLSEALRPPSATFEWASFAQACKTKPGSPAPGLTLIEAETIQEEAAAIALVLREALETEGQTAALVTPDENLIGRVRHALSQWGLTRPVQDAGADALASRVAATAAQAKPEDLVELLRCRQGEAAAARRRFAELIDLGVFRQMWRPSSMAGHSGCPGPRGTCDFFGRGAPPGDEAHCGSRSGRRRGVARNRLLEALSPLASKADERLTLKDWTVAHAHGPIAPCGLGFEKAVAKEDERSTLADAAECPGPAAHARLARAMPAFSPNSATGGERPRARPLIRGFSSGRRSMPGCWRPMSSFSAG